MNININIKKIINSRHFIIVLALFLISLTVITGTYAWFTWSSTENTELTMTIGKFADVVFTSGNDITTGLTPVFNYYDGESTTFSINNRSTESLSYIVKLNIDTIDPELISSDVKYALTKNGALIAKGDLSTASNNSTIDICNSIVTNGTDSLIFYIYIDGNVENDLSMINKTITGTITVEQGEITPLSDFTYYLGSEYSSVSNIHYEHHTSTETELSITPIALESNEILLVQYNGESTDVVVPDTYVIDDITYNVVLFSELYMFSDWGGDMIGVFAYNDIIESVILGKKLKFVYAGEPNSMNGTFCLCSNLVSVPEIPASVTNMTDTFYGCTSLVNVPEIPTSVTSMSYTFQDCTSLVNAPEIPASVTNMDATFYGCTSLVNAPEIPASVTNMNATFRNCTSLVNAPEIPASVTNMAYTFNGCTNLVNAPEIPASVTNMNYTFSNCTNLTGTVRINSSNVSNVTNIFTGTSKPITVEVPAGSTTYTKISALTASNGMPSNVKLSTY